MPAICICCHAEKESDEHYLCNDCDIEHHNDMQDQLVMEAHNIAVQKVKEILDQ